MRLFFGIYVLLSFSVMVMHHAMAKDQQIVIDNLLHENKALNKRMLNLNKELLESLERISLLEEQNEQLAENIEAISIVDYWPE